MKKISVYVPENGSIEAITPAYRLFKTANDFEKLRGKKPLFTVEYVGMKKQIATNDGEYLIKTDRLLSDLNKTDVLILPALYGDLEEAMNANAAALPYIQWLYDNGSEVASLCIGAFLLAASGLVNGKKCSLHWAYYDVFRKAFPDVDIAEDSVITDEGNIYSSGGANSSWNLLLYLLEKYTSRDMAIQAAKFFAIDIDRHSQAAFTIFTGQKNHADKEILQAQVFIENNYEEKITVDKLATKLNISLRNFERRFKIATYNTPTEYLQRVRVEVAKRSFESCRKNVTQVMFDVGYVDIKTFRDIFKRITGLTPIEYRNKYSKLN